MHFLTDNYWSVFLLVLGALWSLLFVYFRRPLLRFWREPMLTEPVFILESDDWGAGPESQVDALNRLASLLSQFKDHYGESPVMTLGIALAVPNGQKISAEKLASYHPLPLSSPRFAALREALMKGMALQVFAPQLHGMEHYWPPAMLEAAKSDGTVANWLSQPIPQPTEYLPAHLQSRWVNASTLPSRPIPKHLIEAAVTKEIAEFRSVFGFTPEVAVPPTFLWNDEVEQAWAQHGVRFLVTPGTRYCGRDAQGGLVPDRDTIVNGQHGQNGITYLVRDDYFEPARGHRADQAIAAVIRKTQLGRPALLEMHRFNFIAEAGGRESAFDELRKLLSGLIPALPNVRFISTAKLARHIAERAPELVETRMRQRIRFWLSRVNEIPRFRKLALLSGLVIPLKLLDLAVGRPGIPAASSPLGTHP
jgi:hypothetical protein